MSKIDARKALDIILDKLTKNSGYYVWTPLGSPKVWLLRVPNLEKNDETWQREKEEAEMIHICRPAKLLEAIEKDRDEEPTLYTGYVHVDEAKCLRCGRELPSDVERKLLVMVKLHTLDRKVS